MSQIEWNKGEILKQKTENSRQQGRRSPKLDQWEMEEKGGKGKLYVQ